MNIVNRLTLRHLKTNMKRTVITVIGIIISVAMVTAVFTSAISFMKFLQNVSIAYDGNWTSIYEDCSQTDIDKLLSSAEVNKVGAYRSDGGVAIGEKVQTSVAQVESTMYDIYSIKLAQGEYPARPNEVLVSQQFLEDEKLDLKVGDFIKVYKKTSEFEEAVQTQYKITGITDTENRFTENYGLITSLDEDYKGSDLKLYVQNTKIDNGIWDIIKQNAESIGRTESDASVNSELFMYCGVVKDNAIMASLGGFAAIMLIIIFVASVFMIYNAFAISFQQRSRYLGMLASVGATKRQKRASVYYEGLILGAIGIPIGIISGLGGMAVTFKCIESALLSTFAIPAEEPLTVSVNLFVILGSVIISIITILISAFVPARKASRTTPIEALRQTNTVKVRSTKLKTSGLAGKLFGYEGQLAQKNYKRNGKRSRMITSALALSVVLFLTVTSFSSIFSQFFSSNYGGGVTDIYLYCSYKDKATVDKTLSEVKTVDGYTCFAEGLMSLENSSKYLSAEGKKYAEKGDFSRLYLYGVPDSEYEAFCKRIGADSSSSDAILVNKAVLKYVAGKKMLKIEPFDDIKGQKVKVSYNEISNYEQVSEDSKSAELSIGAVTDKDVNDSSSVITGSYIVMPFSALFDTFNTENPSISYAVTAKMHEEAYEELDELLGQRIKEHSGFDATKQLASMKSILLIANVFAYGFITLITLISVTNIINTISTSMDERRREFAMIKSVGLTPKSFRRMIYLESLLYGIKALLFGLPISIVLNLLMNKLMSMTYDLGFGINIVNYIIAVVAVFAIIGIALIYSTSKIKKDNIIDTIKREDT